MHSPRQSATWCLCREALVSCLKGFSDEQDCCNFSGLNMARNRPSAMSALQPLSGGKRTHCGHVVTADFDPEPTSRLSPPPSPSRASKVARRVDADLSS